MVRIFVEYHIISEKRLEFLAFMGKIAAQHSNLEVCEGTDQPCLFVEIWQDVSAEQYLLMKQERLQSNDSLWNEMDSYVVGGKGKIHIWSFSPTQFTI